MANYRLDKTDIIFTPAYELPMTDLERFIELWKSFGIEIKDMRGEDESVCKQVEGVATISIGDNNSTEITMTAVCYSDNAIGGYCGFFTVTEFDSCGKFISHSMWESVSYTHLTLPTTPYV